MRRRILLLFVSLVAAVLAQVASPVPASSVTPGGVFVTGHDPDFHAISGNVTGARNIIRAAVKYVTGDMADPDMLLVTSRITPPAGHIDSALGVSAAGYTFDVASAGGASGSLDLATVDFDDYDVVVVASDHGGILTQAELNILNARAGELIDYVNGGGGLVAFSESNQAARLTPGGGHFDYLPFLVSEISAPQGESGYTVTPFGASLGLTNSDVNNNFSHNVFTEAGGFDVVNRDGAGRIISLATRRQICHTGVPRASVGDVAQAEGTSSTPTSFTFEVSLDIAPCAGPVSVDYATADGSATAGNDYTATSGTLTFPVGATTSQSVTVFVYADATFEPDETFSLNLSADGVLEDQATGTILNDDVQNHPPDCSSVTSDSSVLWPANHKMVPVTVTGGTDPDGDAVTLTVIGVTQDEPLDGTGDGDTSPDALLGGPPNSVLLRAERAGSGDGRVYRLEVRASDGQGGTCTTTILVSVPHDRSPGSAAGDSGPLVNSLG